MYSSVAYAISTAFFVRHLTCGDKFITKAASRAVIPKGLVWSNGLLLGSCVSCSIYFGYIAHIFINTENKTTMPRKKKERDTRSEYEIQCEAIEWFRATFPNQVIFSCPNEAARRNWAHFSKSGATSGSPDLVVSIKDRVFFVEYKTQSGQQSDNQKAFEAKCNALGIGYYLCRDLNDLKKGILNEWNKMQNSGLQEVRTQ